MVPSPDCTNFGKLILRKIIKIAATRCHILKLKCTKFDIGWGSAPDPARGAYSVPSDPLAGFKGAYFYGKGRGQREGMGGKGKGGKRKGEDETIPPPFLSHFKPFIIYLLK